VQRRKREASWKWKKKEYFLFLWKREASRLLFGLGFFFDFSFFLDSFLFWFCVLCFSFLPFFLPLSFSFFFLSFSHFLPLSLAFRCCFFFFCPLSFTIRLLFSCFFGVLRLGCSDVLFPSFFLSFSSSFWFLTWAFYTWFSSFPQLFCCLPSWLWCCSCLFFFSLLACFPLPLYRSGVFSAFS